MKLRVALKIRKAVGTPRESRYTDCQIKRAIDRYDRLVSSKYDNEFFRALLLKMGPVGCARVFKRHSMGAAFDMLMSADESTWGGDGGEEMEKVMKKFEGVK